MSKFQNFMVLLKQYHFWVLCLTVAILATGGWFVAASGIDESFKGFEGDINRRVSEMQSIQQNAAHPNETVNQGFQAVNDAHRARILEVWGKLYQRQRSTVLKWPEKLGDDFVRMIDRKKFGDDITIPFRERYQNYVRDRFNELPQIVKAKKLEAATTGGGGEFAGGRSDPNAPKDDYLVEWMDQGKIRDKMVWNDTPSAMKVWLTQEDLWIYETLLNIVAKVNEGVERRYKAPIIAIESMQVGRDAASGSFTVNRIMMPVRGKGAKAPVTEANAEMPADLAQPVEQFGTPEGGGAGDEVTDAAISRAADEAMIANRYLDAKLKPLPKEKPAEVDEYKRIPVRLALVMDQRDVSKLLVACANAPLPIEVVQLRIGNLPETGLGGNFGKVDAKAGGGEIMMPAAPIETGSIGGVSESGENRAAGSSADHVYHVRVVIQGVVYVYNKPDLTKLKMTPPKPGEAPPVVKPADGAKPADGTKPIKGAAPADAAPVDAAPVEEAPPADVPAGETPPAGGEVPAKEPAETDEPSDVTPPAEPTADAPVEPAADLPVDPTGAAPGE